MSKVVRKRLQQIIQCLEQATKILGENYTKAGMEIVQDDPSLVELLTDMQDLAIAFGTRIEELKGLGTQTVTELENYCECLLHVNESMGTADQSEVIKDLATQMEQVRGAFEDDFLDKKEIVFLPYKVSMWDSLESVWKAADADPECEAYVVPIPYYDRDKDGSFKTYHYEGDMYPDDVPITDYREYDFDKHRPDAIFIHNPYDAANLVTSVDPSFYSDQLKKYTNCLVYIPYYATAGNMAEGQALCPAYIHADYIVIQHESYREFFDPRIPDEKFLALGSPKFDRIIHMCKKPPEVPDTWKELAKGKKVYFYNTSIGGMLENTENFLKKMDYVFQQFENRKDACMLWRPHPLLESTFASMRKQYLPVYEALKQRFFDKKLGIYDDTPNIENSIVFSDAYIGDAASSVTSLFGVVGKPMFILNNRIHRLPEKDDWKGTVYYMPRGDHEDRYVVTYGNQLYYSPENDGKYQFYCNLSEYASGNYYYRAVERKDEVFVFPANAEHILVIDKKKNIQRIELEHKIQRNSTFADIFILDEYVFLVPSRYPDLVRFNVNTKEVDYVRGVGTFNAGMINGEWKYGARCMHQGKLRIFSHSGEKYLVIDAKTLKYKVFQSDFHCGYIKMIPENEEQNIFWLLPDEGTIVRRWNGDTGESEEFDLYLDGMFAWDRYKRVRTNQNYFGSVAIGKGVMIFAPYFGSKFVSLELKTGQISEWIPPFTVDSEDDDCYYLSMSEGLFFKEKGAKYQYLLYCDSNRKTYRINLENKEEIVLEVLFSEVEVRKHVHGFTAQSQWMRYCCYEDVFHTLREFLDGTLLGEEFTCEKQLEEFSKINASINGDCGKKAYEFVCTRIGESV